MKRKIFLTLAIIAVLVCVFATMAGAQDAVPDSYVESEDAYIIYTDAQYKEVILGVYDGTMANKTIVLGCDISVTLDLAMEKPCDITIDLNGKTYTNNYLPAKWGDFDLRHKNAIIRIKNGHMVSNFCVFIFQTNRDSQYKDVDNMGQVYLENVNIDSREEIVYAYGGYGGVLSFTNCNLNVTGDFSTNGGGSCGTGSGVLYQIDGCRLDGFNFHCARPGSYMRNSTVYDRQLFVDSWHSHGGESNNGDVTVEISNVVIEKNIKLNDGRVDPELYDCTFASVDLTGGGQLLVAYTSATCTSAATKTVYNNANDVGVLDEQYSIDNAALGHRLDMESIADVKYASFLEIGAYVSSCVRCGTENVEEENGSASPIFACLGYAVYEKGDGGLTIAFSVNRDALESYEQITGKTVKYGAFAAAQNKLGSGDVFDKDGKVTHGVVASPTTGYKTTVFDMKIFGFNTGLKDTLFALGAYAQVSGNGETEYFYMQSNAAKDGERYYFASYNEIVSLLV